MKLTAVNEISGGCELLVQAVLEIENEAKPACAAETVFRYLTG